MSNLTTEQLLAVNKQNTNIIVSAGAGSGKTTVLKERVLRILNQGIDINKLIILTFTNNAAKEMKERIRKIINDNNLEDQALLLDQSYITTFDSFAQSLVKKYNYLLNISKDFTIVDATIVKTELNNIIDIIFERLYKEQNPKFIKLISDFCIKDDKNIRDSIIKSYQSLGNLIDKNDFLNNYITKFYSDNAANIFLDEYEEYVLNLKDDITTLLDCLNDETINQDKLSGNMNATVNFINSSSIDDLKYSIDFSLARALKNVYTDEGKEIKEEIATKIKELKSHLQFTKLELKENYLSTKEYAEIVIDILKEIDVKLNEFKDIHNSYEFSDIALKAIKLVKENEDVKNEIKNNTFEIMIDEYQDTNDIQETFISLIQNNNVYMVGDIKQSIYRFRNANPYIFKNKYDSYKNNDNGFKIDLNKNFRSRNEVINNINLIFDNIMFDNIGGADYKNEHEMIFGNTNYNDNKVNDNYDLEILNYNNSDKKYKQIDIEAFTIANDILTRIKNKEQVAYFEDNKMNTRNITFKDFVILIDKSKNFETIKKILESFKIPCTIDKDIDIKNDDEIYILKNIINLIINIKNNCYDNSFKHYFISLARSYLFNMSDDEIFDIFTNNTFKNTNIFKYCYELSLACDGISNKELLTNIIDRFDFINKITTVYDIDDRLTKLEYFLNNAEALNKFGYDIYDLNNYFDEIIDNTDNKFNMSINSSDSNSVKIMTIHKSKGLEFPYVYLSFLNSSFANQKNDELFSFTNKYGIIFPFYKDGIGKTFINTLNKNYEFKETLSEKIRLFYVALTRAKEKIIIINEYNEKINPINRIINENDLLKCTSYNYILNILRDKLNQYIKYIDIDTLNINNDYNLVKSFNYKKYINNSSQKINTTNLTINNKIEEYKHFSKSMQELNTKELQQNLDFGIYMHYVFEIIDFKNNNIEELNVNDFVKEKIKNFFKHEEFKNIKNANIFKEHEIMFEDNDNHYHGFIDLLLEYEDHFDIVDYKLSNIDSTEYEKQLNGYKKYIEKKYNKPTNIYLYSINQDILKKLQ